LIAKTGSKKLIYRAKLQQHGHDFRKLALIYFN